MFCLRRDARLSSVGVSHALHYHHTNIWWQVDGLVPTHNGFGVGFKRCSGAGLIGLLGGARARCRVGEGGSSSSGISGTEGGELRETNFRLS